MTKGQAEITGDRKMANTIFTACHREADRFLSLAQAARAAANLAAKEGQYGDAMSLRDIEAQHRASRWDALHAAKAA
jgi:hypothetical protein